MTNKLFQKIKTEIGLQNLHFYELENRSNVDFILSKTPIDQKYFNINIRLIKITYLQKIKLLLKKNKIVILENTEFKLSRKFLTFCNIFRRSEFLNINYLIEKKVLNVKDDIFYLTGFPGSSNILTASILKEIIDRKIKQNVNFEFLQGIQIKFFQKFHIKILNILNINKKDIREKISYPSIDDQNLTIRYLEGGSHFNEKNFLNFFAFSFPFHSILMSRYQFSHHYLDKKYINRLKSLGIKPFYQIRNPTETLISAANKFSYKNQSVVLNNYSYFKSLCESVKKYYEVCISYADDLVIINAEKRNEDAGIFVKKLASKISVEMSGIEANEIWLKFYNKPLKPLNFDNPIENKTKQFLNIKHFEIIKETGLEKAAFKLGYKIKDQNFSHDENFRFNMDKELSSNFANFSDMMWDFHNHKVGLEKGRKHIQNYKIFNLNFKFLSHSKINKIISKRKLTKLYKKYYKYEE
jgi:hypothetical protein